MEVFPLGRVYFLKTRLLRLGWTSSEHTASVLLDISEEELHIQIFNQEM